MVLDDGTPLVGNQEVAAAPRAPPTGRRLAAGFAVSAAALMLAGTAIFRYVPEGLRRPPPSERTGLVSLTAAGRCHGFEKCPEYPMPYKQQEWPTEYSYMGKFPDGFVWGLGTAAYQIEGGWNEGGRQTSIWDDLTHMAHLKLDTGDVACDHYHRFRDDVAIMARLGLKAYRFSISWPRLLSNLQGDVNSDGARFYSDLIDALLENGITPWVTIYHWDLPSYVNNAFGGWLGPKEKMTGSFATYARTCFELFGDRVKHWFTINEPWCAASVYNFMNGWPARVNGADTDPYTAGHNMLLAHAEAVHIYRAEFQNAQGGQISIALNLDWVHPSDATSQPDVDAAQRARDFQLGWFADPIQFGDYPKSMRDAAGGRLPRFTASERERVRGSWDFFAINSYQTSLATPAGAAGAGEGALLRADSGHAPGADPGWERADQGWPVVPWGFRDLLLYIQGRYAPPGGIFVAENGCAHEPPGARPADLRPGGISPAPRGAVPPPPGGEEDWGGETFDDPRRVRYLRAYLSAVDAARARGADVRGYFLWSLLDNFEWDQGYAERFGTTYTDYDFGADPDGPTDSEQPRPGKQLRRRKDSNCWLEAVWRSNALVDPNGDDFRGCVRGSTFTGNYTDSKKPGCARSIVVDHEGAKAHISGTEAVHGHECDGKTTSWGPIVAKISGGSIIMDMSSFGGLDHHAGFWNDADSIINWADGSSWHARRHRDSVIVRM
mmetsp:Transcript_74245/g.209708  ORF Transcript_74245/g.209708 Transcript_74245/m.209708 type:complete len:722 (-) Transcript_74245:87-2252(-)